MCWVNGKKNQCVLCRNMWLHCCLWCCHVPHQKWCFAMDRKTGTVHPDAPLFGVPLEQLGQPDVSFPWPLSVGSKIPLTDATMCEIAWNCHCACGVGIWKISQNHLKCSNCKIENFAINFSAHCTLQGVGVHPHEQAFAPMKWIKWHFWCKSSHFQFWIWQSHPKTQGHLFHWQFFVLLAENLFCQKSFVDNVPNKTDKIGQIWSCLHARSCVAFEFTSQPRQISSGKAVACATAFKWNICSCWWVNQFWHLAKESSLTTLQEIALRFHTHLLMTFAVQQEHLLSCHKPNQKGLCLFSFILVEKWLPLSVSFSLLSIQESGMGWKSSISGESCQPCSLSIGKQTGAIFSVSAFWAFHEVEWSKLCNLLSMSLTLIGNLPWVHLHFNNGANIWSHGSVWHSLVGHLVNCQLQISQSFLSRKMSSRVKMHHFTAGSTMLQNVPRCEWQDLHKFEFLVWGPPEKGFLSSGWPCAPCGDCS